MGTSRTALATVVIGGLVVALGACGQVGAGPTTAHTATVTHHGYFVEYETVDALLAAADTVVTGVVLDRRTELIELEEPEFTGTDPVSNPTFGAPGPGDPGYEEPEPSVFVYSIYDVEVDQPVEGRYEAGDRIEVRLVGGQLDGELHVWTDVVHPVVGESYAFFLSDLAPGEAEALTPVQGLFRELADGEFAPLSRTSERAVTIADDLGLALD